jgi:hypothetical protein
MCVLVILLWQESLNMILETNPPYYQGGGVTKEDLERSSRSKGESF